MLYKAIARAYQTYTYSKRINKDARLIGSVEWAKHLSGWFDDVSQFGATSDGGILLKKLDLTVPNAAARWLLGRNKNYEYCLQLQEQGVAYGYENNCVVANYLGAKFVLEPDTLYILWELIVGSAYRWIPANKPMLIFDVGMNVGFSALIFALRFPHARVVGFEPFAPTYERMKRNLALNPELAARITHHPVALSDHDGIETWNFSSTNAGTSSQFFSDPADCVKSGSVSLPVELKSATSAMSPHVAANAAGLCVVKMDCEGGEYAIFSDWKKSGIGKKIDLLVMEYHEVGGHSRSELEQWLADNQFVAVIQPQLSGGRPCSWGSIVAAPIRSRGSNPP